MRHSRRSPRRWRNPTGCLPPGPTCRRRACSTPIDAASSPGTGGPAGAVVEPRSADGAVGRRVPASALAAPSVVRSGGFEIRVRQRVPRGDRGAAPRCRAPGRTAPGSRPTMIDGVLRAARARQRALGRDLARRARSSAASTASRIGRMFFGESMFARERDASKVALVHLVALLRARGCPMIDCQQETAHLASLRRAADSARASLPSGSPGW